MKHFFLVIKKFYKNNGLLGVSLKKVNQLRGGADFFRKVPHTELLDETSSGTAKKRLTSQEIDEILNDDRISDAEKDPFHQLRADPIFGDSEEVMMNRLQKSLIDKTKHQLYSRIKCKLPFVILTPFTFSELTRLAAYRAAGFVSVPLTIPGLIGFSLPCAVTFSMLEMYAPDKFKFPCKCAKWSGGFIFYGVSSSIDYLTAGFETEKFGQSLPIDAPNLMGTLPQMADLEELRKFKKLADSMIQKST
jgi:hypothetical protein